MPAVLARRAGPPDPRPSPASAMALNSIDGVTGAELDALRDERPARVLDLGCGTGLLTERLRRELGSPSVTGADFSAGVVSLDAGNVFPMVVRTPAVEPVPAYVRFTSRATPDAVVETFSAVDGVLNARLVPGRYDVLDDL